MIVLFAIFNISAPALVAAVKRRGGAKADAKRAELHAQSWAALNALLDDLPKFIGAVEANKLH